MSEAQISSMSVSGPGGQNRLDIKNGCILRLTKAPGRSADDLYKGIQSSDGGVRCDSLKELASVSRDVTFAQEFISRDGHVLLVKIVEDSNENNQIMTHTLTGFMELMDHGIVSWENLSAVFIKKIAGFVNSKSTDESMQQVSLDILENMVLSSRKLFLQVKQEVTMERLIAHLQVANQQIQTKAMALLMALLQTAEDADRQEMFAFLNKKNLRQYIYKNIILSSSPVQDEMAHYLYVLQSVTLNHLEARMRTPLDCYSQDQRDILHRLRQAAFETESENNLNHERRRSLCAKEFKKLGFSNNSNPGQDLVRTPPGLLALDTMYYFASGYPDAYSRFVLENSSREDKHECPFARSSIQLTLILCEILRIGESPSETGSNYHPIFFSQDQLLEELFCVCIQLLNKTWKEMRATQEDFDKVALCHPSSAERSPLNQATFCPFLERSGVLSAKPAVFVHSRLPRVLWDEDKGALGWTKRNVFCSSELINLLSFCLSCAISSLDCSHLHFRPFSTFPSVYKLSGSYYLQLVSSVRFLSSPLLQLTLFHHLPAHEGLPHSPCVPHLKRMHVGGMTGCGEFSSDWPANMAAH
ncbi:hypothetical protein ATANTOWER_007601 [Ataeniobius toweri]|uniref:ELMO domain-containing protein n=1 Tax=Ataeniobius toweri TaxID=208326 RepID=A0ABU7ANS4_9TELE|nr:hypothetical protein [Ataeniobius toweri]